MIALFIRNAAVTFAACICCGVIGIYVEPVASHWAIGVLSVVFAVIVAAGFDN